MSKHAKAYVGWQEERQERERAEEQRREESRRENEAARKKYLAELDARREVRRQEADKALELQLEQKKQYLMRDWLAQHPGKTDADFNKQAWPLLRQNILEDDKRATADATKQRLRQSGNYGW